MAISLSEKRLSQQLVEDCEIFVQNGPLFLAAYQTLISEARLTDCTDACKLPSASKLIIVSGGDGLLHGSERRACMIDVT